MRLNQKTFEELTNRELYQILQLRSQIFVVEQNCIYLDPDGKDYDGTHIFLEDNGILEAYLRLIPRQGQKDSVHMGRVLTRNHGKGYGRLLLKEGVRVAKQMEGIRKLYIEAQSYAVGFYEKEGFHVISEEFMEDGIPHVKMEQEF